MKLVIRFSTILLAILMFNSPIAAENITGTWQGELVVSPETELKIQFIISQGDDGSYTVVLNSPDQGAIKDIKANSVVYNSGNLKLDVAELSGAYEGVVKDKKIEGNWMQEGASMPLDLTPYVKPVLTREDKEKLLGSWNGPLEFPGGSLTLVFRFEMAENGEFVGFLDSPDQGASGIPVTDIEMENGIVTVKVSGAQLEYKGKIADDEIVGEFNQRGQARPLALKRGEYKVKGINLDVSADDREKILGPWHGQFESPRGVRTAIIRFETTEDGEFVGFVDSPDPGSILTPVSDVKIEGDKITVNIEKLGAEFNGEIKGDKIVGEAKQGSELLSITLIKGEYIPPVYSLDLSKEAMGQLLGEWQGKLGPLTMIFRFEKTENGEFVGFIEVPEQGVKGNPIIEAAFSDGKLTLKEKMANAEYSGQLSDNGLVGEWKQMGRSNPLTLTKK